VNPTNENEYGSTVVINHSVKPAEHRRYDAWLDEIGPVCRASPGILDWQIVRPIAGLTERYTVIIRFHSHEQLRNWMDSTDRKRLIEKVRPLLVQDDAYTIHSGLDFLFIPASAGPKVPVRWKQFLITWSAIYPLALAVPLAIVPLLRAFGGAESRALATLITTGAIVLLMVYIVMPHYTKLVRKWLFA
jgi:uncharacterized protein